MLGSVSTATLISYVMLVAMGVAFCFDQSNTKALISKNLQRNMAPSVNSLLPHARLLHVHTVEYNRYLKYCQ